MSRREPYELTRSQWVPRSREECYAFFSEPHNLARITPAWLRFRIVGFPAKALRRGARIEYRIRWLGFPLKWVTLIRRWEPPLLFVDQQIRGPYGYWLHEHRFTESGGGTTLEDRVRYRIPLGALGRLLHRLLIRRQLDYIFDFRARRIREILGAKDDAAAAPIEEPDPARDPVFPSPASD